MSTLRSTIKVEIQHLLYYSFTGIATEGKALDHFCYRNQSSAIPYSFQGRIDFSAHFSSQLELNIAQHSRQWSGNLDISPSEFMLYYKSNRKNMSGLTGTTADCYVPSESFPPIALRSHSKLGPSDSTLPGVHSRGESCRGKRKRPWSTQEDNFLLELVKQSDRISWVDISNRMGGRSAKQCRERYHNHLMEVNKGEWTEEGTKTLLVFSSSRDMHLSNMSLKNTEDRYIFEQQKMYGNKWAKIARELPGRSDAQVSKLQLTLASFQRASCKLFVGFSPGKKQILCLPEKSCASAETGSIR